MQRARILVVDDERPSVDIISRILSSRGHDVTGAASAEEALKVLQGASFDLVLLDLVLPGMTGLQALSQMKALTQAPIHLMSGQTDDETRNDALALGASGFLPKPLDLKGLHAIVEALPAR
ncbi:MAG: hypothetical protein A2V88_12030 [Elusimicrobia bacterium RBG_16_66_12]|nr:MAG: hypothetical protein A2V88_12030 [Elusimicrobia bacterium RBG_16_66_12]